MAAATLPAQFGRYRILKQLGHGGMGTVYLAHDTQLERRVALKVPHIDPDDGPSVLQRFFHEARAAATLNHPNLCQVFDVGDQDGIPYLTMAFVEGRTLAQLLDEGPPLPQRKAANIVRKLALALQAAHARGVIHRDLKPANVMMNEAGEPVVMDFGLARQANRKSARLTQTGSIIGTPSYMPPEQVRGEVDAMGPGCDIYSLGVILYELLAGRVPFDGPVGVVLGQILTQQPPAPSVHRRGIDPRLEAICLHAMQKEVTARYVSMSDLAEALTETLRPPSRPGHADAPAKTQRNERSERRTGVVVVRPLARRWSVGKRGALAFLGDAKLRLVGSLLGLLLWFKNYAKRPRATNRLAVILVAGLALMVVAVAVWGLRDKGVEPNITPRDTDRAQVHADVEKDKPVQPKIPPPDKDLAKLGADAQKDKRLEPKIPPADESLAQLRNDADKGEAAAQYELGKRYAAGAGVTKDAVEAATWLRQAAEHGNIDVQSDVGWRFMNGEGVAKDDAEAVQWLRRAAEGGNINAQTNLGLMLENGRGAKKDDVEAARMYRKAAEKGHATAQKSLGVMLQTGRGVKRDESEAANWYRKAAEQGNASAQHNLGLMLENGRGVKKDAVEAVRWYRKAAEAYRETAELGDAMAQYNLGLMRQTGRGVNRDDGEAATWYRKAAEQGNASAQHNLGLMLENGRGVKKDAVEAVKWYRKAAEAYRETAEQGDAMAQYNLGLMLQAGRGVAKNDLEAVYWYRKSAEQDFALAQTNLGVMLDSGRDIPKDAVEAVMWYRKAAVQGDASGQSNLGSCLAVGRGVPMDPVEAVYWYRKSAAQGNQHGQSNLGVMYENGRGGLGKDVGEAVRLYRLAEVQGNEFARQALIRLGKK